VSPCWLDQRLGNTQIDKSTSRLKIVRMKDEYDFFIGINIWA
jgi:hypothetical protein